LYDKVERPLEGWAYSFLGQIYVALPFAMCNVLYFRFSPLILLSLFVFIWVNDTGAYLVGCTIGKHRLFERISPKKSWEGFWGGLILAAATAYVASLYLGILNTWQWIGLALVCSVFGTWGDLCESLIIIDSGACVLVFRGEVVCVGRNLVNFFEVEGCDAVRCRFFFLILWL
jgi:phosphatidate cytidylyltransferase